MKRVEDRFWAKVDKTDECWLWTAATNRLGYGDFWDGTKRLSGANRIVRAHRFAYELQIGRIPDGLEIDHVCHVRSCVNPEHLRTVTRKQNLENTVGGIGASGLRGVSSTKGGKWRARVCHHGNSVLAGVFSTPEEAAEAAADLRRKLFTHNDADRVA